MGDSADYSSLVKLNLSALYLSQKRMNEILDANILGSFARHFGLADRETDSLLRRNVLTLYEDAALKWLRSASLPSLGQLIAEGRIRQGKFFTHLGPFWGRHIIEAAMRFDSKRALRREPVLWTKLDDLAQGLSLTLQAHPENYTTVSAAGELSGRHRLLLIGRLTDCDTKALRAQAYLVGYLHEEPRPDRPDAAWLNALAHRMEVFPSQIDNFDRCADERAPTVGEQQRLLEVPEAQIKQAFAEIIGESYVPKDWGGELSDLVSSRVRVNGKALVAAFAFKGPAKPRKLTVADLGRNGDQLFRLFSEPSHLVVLQHCHEIAQPVRGHMRSFAERMSNLKPFCIIDGADTIRIMRAYRKLGFSRRARTLSKRR